MKFLTKDPMEYTFNHEGRTFGEAVDHIENMDDRNTLTGILYMSERVYKTEDGMVAFILENLTGQRFTKSTHLAEYLLHALEPKTIQALLAGLAIKDKALMEGKTKEQYLVELLKGGHR